jgi:hypothetical protein
MNVLSRIEQTLLVCDFLRGWAFVKLVAQIDAAGGDVTERDRDVGRSPFAQASHQVLGDAQRLEAEPHTPLVVVKACFDVAASSTHTSPPVADPLA